MVFYCNYVYCNNVSMHILQFTSSLIISVNACVLRIANYSYDHVKHGLSNKVMA